MSAKNPFDIAECPSTPIRPPKRDIPNAPARETSEALVYHEHVLSCQLPPGRYYVGDLSYALDVRTYNRIFEAQKTGLFTIVSTTDRSSGKLEKMILLQAQSIRKGEFQGSDFMDYSCDSGYLGIMPESCISRHEWFPLGHVHEFEEPVFVEFLDGVFNVYKMRVVNGMINMDQRYVTIYTNDAKNCWLCGCYQEALLTVLSDGYRLCDTCLFDRDSDRDSDRESDRTSESDSDQTSDFDRSVLFQMSE